MTCGFFHRLFCGGNRHRAEETGGLEWVLALVFDDVGARAALVLRELAVANQAVGPVIDDFDFEFVLAGLDGLRDVHSPGRTPEHAQVFSVECDLRRLYDISEIEENLRFQI